MHRQAQSGWLCGTQGEGQRCSDVQSVLNESDFVGVGAHDGGPAGIGRFTIKNCKRKPANGREQLNSKEKLNLPTQRQEHNLLWVRLAARQRQSDRKCCSICSDRKSPCAHTCCDACVGPQVAAKPSQDPESHPPWKKLDLPEPFAPTGIGGEGKGEEECGT